jgi:hypothetical protein
MAARTSTAVVLCLLVARPLAAQEDEQPKRVVRSYPISGFLDAGGPMGFRLLPAGNLIFSPYRNADSPAPEPFGPDSSWSPAAIDDERRRGTPTHFDGLELIETFLAQLNGGEIPGIVYLVGSEIEARTSATFHKVIAEMFHFLERAGEARLQVEAVVAGSAVLERVAPGWRERLPDFDADAFETARQQPEARSFSIVARERLAAAIEHRGPARRARGGRWTQAARDLDIEPVPRIEPFAGKRLELRAASIPGSDRVVVDLVYGDVGESLDASIAPEGAAPALKVDEVLISASAVVSAGKAVAIGGIRAPAPAEGPPGGRGDAVVLVRVRKPTPGRLEPLAIEFPDRFLSAHPVGHLRGGIPRLWPAQDFSSLRAWETGDLIERLKETTGGYEAWEPAGGAIECRMGQLWIIAPRPLHDAVETEIKRLSARVLRSALVEIRRFELPRAALAKLPAGFAAGRTLPAGWESGLLADPGVKELRAFLHGLDGETHAVRAARIVATRAASSSTEDERSAGEAAYELDARETCGDGVELRVRAWLEEDRDRARLWVRGAEATLLGWQDQVLVVDDLDAPQRAPLQAVRPWTVDLYAPLNQDVLLAHSIESDDRAQLLVGRVRAAEPAAGKGRR